MDWNQQAAELKEKLDKCEWCIKEMRELRGCEETINRLLKVRNIIEEKYRNAWMNAQLFE
jgi:hypothetical protein